MTWPPAESRDASERPAAAVAWEHEMFHVDTHGDVVAERARPERCELCRAAALLAGGKLVAG